MKKENNYPIAYAVLELKEKGGYIDSYADITQGFIASKCYVLESSVVYNSDGSCKFVHKVVFPYNDIKGFKAAIKNGSHNIGDKEEVKYDAYGNAFPVSIVTELYDSFEVAKLAAKVENDKYLLDLFLNRPAPKGEVSSKVLNESFKHLQKEFKKGLEICNLYEEFIKVATEDMIITSEAYRDYPYIRILKPMKK